MPKTSPVTLAIETIAECLMRASEATRRLDNSASQDLRSLLHIATCETERVRKTLRKTAAAKKPGGQTASKSAKNGRATAMPKAVAQQAKTTARRRPAATNGIAAH